MTMTNRQGRRPSGSRGYAAVGVALALPLLFVVIFLAVQAGLWFFARSVCLAAAQEGARTSAARDASLQGGLDTASTFAGRVGSGMLTGISVTGDRSGTSTTVVVSGVSVRLVPFMDLQVTQSATLPVERLT